MNTINDLTDLNSSLKFPSVPDTTNTNFGTKLIFYSTSSYNHTI